MNVCFKLIVTARHLALGHSITWPKSDKSDIGSKQSWQKSDRSDIGGGQAEFMARKSANVTG
jgi:hypothetical protein